MSYLEESLSKGEKLNAVFRLHWIIWARIGAWGAASAFALFHGFRFAAGILLFAALGEWVKLNSIEQAVTNKRVIQKTGIVSRKTEEMKLSSIETVEIQQSIWGRIFGYGTVKVTGRGLSDVVFKGIDDPMRVKRMIESADHPDDQESEG